MMTWTTFSRSWGNLIESLDGIKWFLVIVCAWITLLFCFLLLAGCQTESVPPAPPIAVASVDSFCSAYKRVIGTEHEGASLHSAARPVKERIAANDALYRCECQGWDNPICARVKH